jgi:transcriptional regulator with XRE-family HTH domain
VVDGAEVVRRRKEMRLSQGALGKLAGVDRSTVSLIELGQSPGNMRTLTKLAFALGCRVKDLLVGDPADIAHREPAKVAV